LKKRERKMLKDFTLYIELTDGATVLVHAEMIANSFGIVPTEVLEGVLPFLYPHKKGTGFAKFVKRTKLGNYLWIEIPEEEIPKLN